MTSIAGIAEAAESILGKVGESVVGVRNGWLRGSGVVLSPGHVLTSAHNVRGEELTVVFGDGREAPGTPSGVDVDGGIAVLSVETGDAPALDWSTVDEVRAGAPVFAVANPGGRGLRVTFGVVSATERRLRGPWGRRMAAGIEHTAPLVQGSSGSPIFDADGNVLGFSTLRLGEGFCLAIPADAALRERADALARGEEPTRRRLGISIAPSHLARRLRRAVGLPDVEGLLVRGVEEGSVAERAAILDGDLIVGAGGKDIRDIEELLTLLDQLDPEASIELRLLRGSEERAVTVSFSER